MKRRYDNKKALLVDVKKEKPSLIFLTGKTASGKTTFAKKMSLFGYQVIFMDEIIKAAVLDKYNIKSEDLAFSVYSGKAPASWTKSFISSLRREIITKSKRGPVIIEGALTDNKIIKEIFRGEINDFIFIFFLPLDIDAHANRIKKKFLTGIKTGQICLPKYFLQTIAEEEIRYSLNTHSVNAAVLKKIKNFAVWSKKESKKRLAYFRQSFSDTIVIEV